MPISAVYGDAPLPAMQTKWQPLHESGQAFGHIFRASITQLSYIILRIQQIAAERWSTTFVWSRILTKINILALPFTLIHIFQRSYKANKSKIATSGSQNTPPQTPKALESNLQTHSLIKEKPLVISPSGQEINVPDDGNCLHYAIAVGLAKKYHNNPEIQAKSQWLAPLDKLTGDLRNKANLLKEPGATLRHQAAEYLEKNHTNDEVAFALMEGVWSHLEVASRKIDEEEAVIPILENDIRELEKRPKSPLIAKQMQQKLEQVQIKQESIALQKKRLPSENNLREYIELSKEDRFYCGAPQVLALAKYYGIPIRVVYHSQNPNIKPHEQIFNGQNQSPTLITLVYRENHFKYLDI